MDHGHKRLVAGDLKPGRYPLWGLTYFRWWLGDRLGDLAPTYLLTGSSLYVHWLRALGAKVGHDTLIGSITLRAPNSGEQLDHTAPIEAVARKDAIASGMFGM